MANVDLCVALCRATAQKVSRTRCQASQSWHNSGWATFWCPASARWTRRPNASTSGTGIPESGCTSRCSPPAPPPPPPPIILSPTNSAHPDKTPCPGGSTWQCQEASADSAFRPILPSLSCTQIYAATNDPSAQDGNSQRQSQDHAGTTRAMLCHDVYLPPKVKSEERHGIRAAS